MIPFDVPLGFSVHIVVISDITPDFPIGVQHNPKFPRSDVRTPQSRTNDWDVVLSADRTSVKPIKRHFSGWTHRFCCRRPKSSNEIFFSRHAWSDLVDFLLCDRFARSCVTCQRNEHYQHEQRLDDLSCFVHRMKLVAGVFPNRFFEHMRLVSVCRDWNFGFHAV